MVTFDHTAITAFKVAVSFYLFQMCRAWSRATDIKPVVDHAGFTSAIRS